jgi:hypothetical protein
MCPPAFAAAQRQSQSPGYLAEVEASHLDSQAIPGAIVLQVKREIAAETKRLTRNAFGMIA